MTRVSLQRSGVWGEIVPDRIRQRLPAGAKFGQERVGVAGYGRRNARVARILPEHVPNPGAGSQGVQRNRPFVSNWRTTRARCAPRASADGELASAPWSGRAGGWRRWRPAAAEFCSLRSHRFALIPLWFTNGRSWLKRHLSLACHSHPSDTSGRRPPQPVRSVPRDLLDFGIRNQLLNYRLLKAKGLDSVHADPSPLIQSERRRRFRTPPVECSSRCPPRPGPRGQAAMCRQRGLDALRFRGWHLFLSCRVTNYTAG